LIIQISEKENKALFFVNSSAVEHIGNTFLRNVGKYPSDIASHFRRPKSSKLKRVSDRCSCTNR